MGKHLTSLWSLINQQLLSSLGEIRYESWIRNATLVRADDEVVVIAFRSTYLLEKMEALCRKEVEDSARRVTNRNVRVRFEVAPTEDWLEHRRKETFESFIPGVNNIRARTAAIKFADGDMRAPILIQASSGLGKTHLLRAIQKETKEAPVVYFTGAGFVRERALAEEQGVLEPFRKLCAGAHVLLMDDLHLLAEHPSAAREFARMLDHLRGQHRHAAMATARHPREFRSLPTSIRNRFLSGEEFLVWNPDYDTRFLFLRTRTPAHVADDVLRPIAERITTNHKDLRECLRRLLTLNEPTAAAAQAVATDFLNQWSPGLSLDDIARATSKQYGISMKDLYSDGRTRSANEARKACFFLSRRLLGRSYAAIGRHFGRRGHATVMDACRSLQSRPNSDIRVLLKKLEGRKR